MPEDKHPLTQKEFRDIFAKVPRLTVEVIIRSDKGIYLTKRDIEPFKGTWHIPGGTVRYAEPVIEAVARVARMEVGIVVNSASFFGYIEYPSHYKNGLGTPVGLVFVVADYDGEVGFNEEATEADWFSVAPANMHGDQDDYLIEHGFLQARKN